MVDCLEKGEARHEGLQSIVRHTFHWLISGPVALSEWILLLTDVVHVPFPL